MKIKLIYGNLSNTKVKWGWEMDYIGRMRFEKWENPKKISKIFPSIISLRHYRHSNSDEFSGLVKWYIGLNLMRYITL